MPNLIEIEHLRKYVSQNGLQEECRTLHFRGCRVSRYTHIMVKNKNEVLRLQITNEKPTYSAFVVPKNEAQKKIWKDHDWLYTAEQGKYVYFIYRAISEPLPCPKYTEVIDDKLYAYDLISIRDYAEWLRVDQNIQITITTVYNAAKNGSIRYTVPARYPRIEPEKIRLANMMIIFDETAKTCFLHKKMLAL